MVSKRKVNRVLKLEKQAQWEMDEYSNVLYQTKVKLIKACQQLTKEDAQYLENNYPTNND